MHTHARLPREVMALNSFFKNWQTITIINLQGNNGSSNKLRLAPPWAAVRSKRQVWVRKCSKLTKKDLCLVTVIILPCRDKKFGKEKDFRRLLFHFLLSSRHLCPPLWGKHTNGQTNVCVWLGTSKMRFLISRESFFTTTTTSLTTALCSLYPSVTSNSESFAHHALRVHRPTERGQEQAAGAKKELLKIVLMK